MLIRKCAKQCDRCHEAVVARYRTLIDRFLCERCYTITLGQIAAWRAGTEPPAEEQPES